ncbi:SDR family oxidoreductase [Patescibacteria group bacterium]|nr:SDR family oxidoreductase [Patescibacteria group bacterium]
MKRVIITGASDGLGLELAKSFLKKGYEVLSVSRRNPNLKGVIHLKTDLTKDSDIDKTAEIIKKRFNTFAHLINCAGVINIKPINALDYKETEKLFRVNAIAPMIFTSRLIDLIKKNEADVVNVGSTVGFKAYEDQCAYGSSKWAVRGLNENLRLELKKSKVRVIGFMPGGFKSNFVEKYTGVKADLDPYMEPKDLAKFMIQILELPKKLVVSEVIINRKSV